MPKLPVVTSRELVRALERIGFVRVHQVGSHAQFKNEEGKRITVSIHAGETMKRKTLHGIIRDTGFTVKEFQKFL